MPQNRRFGLQIQYLIAGIQFDDSLSPPPNLLQWKYLMNQLRVGTAQFENRDGDKDFNLSRVESLTASAADQGAQIVSFHECCIPAYSWTQPLSSVQLKGIAEPVPGWTLHTKTDRNRSGILVDPDGRSV